MEHIKSLFRNNAEISALVSQAGKVSAMQKIWCEIAPQPLNRHSQAGSIKHKRLTVYAENGPIAAKIKLLSPNLLTQLQKKGFEVTSIRVEVQVQVQSNSIKSNLPPRKLSKEASSLVFALADQLSGTELGNALKRLSGRVEI